MKDQKYISTIEQSIRLANLDLSNLTLMLPQTPNDGALISLMAGLAGAKTVYVMSKDVTAMNKIERMSYDLKLETKFAFIEKETPEMLEETDILVKGTRPFEIDAEFVSKLNKNSVISLFPNNFEFNKASKVDFDACYSNKIPILALDPEDKTLMLYKYLAGSIVKRCSEINIDLFRSRILLISNGELMKESLNLLKSTNAQAFAIHTDQNINTDYIIKHLPYLDAVVVADYPNQLNLIIGKNGLITIDDIVDINPDVKIVHLAGNVDTRALSFNSIEFTPKQLKNEGLNVNYEDFGLRAIADVSAGVLGIAASFLKTKNLTDGPKDSILSYRIANMTHTPNMVI